MYQLKEISHTVIYVLLRICPHRVAVAGTEQAHHGDVVIGRRGRWKRRGAVQSEVFTSTGLDQAVQRVVGEIGAGFDTAIPEEDDVLYVGVVLDMGDVVRWLISIGK